MPGQAQRGEVMALPADLKQWLLNADPALRWQVERDLLHEPEAVWRAPRARVADEGYGARLLAEQDPDGQWAGGAFFPVPGHPSAWVEGQQGQPYTATTWSLRQLCEWGLDASALADTADRLAANSRWEYDDLPYWGGEVDVCINSYTLATGTWLGADVSALAGWFAEHQLDDGGWNCEWIEGATAASFHSTLNAVKGLLYREAHSRSDEGLAAVRRRGEGYLLERRLTRRLSTGALVADWVSELGYPFRWKYNVLSALDHFRRAAIVDGIRPDPRLADAIEIVASKRQPDGRWLSEVRQPGQVWFDVDVPVGQPSPWLTLYALRVLNWWTGGYGGSA